MARDTALVPLAEGVDAVPVLHGRLESAVAVARAIREVRPDHVCVELPVTLGQAVTLGVERLPRLSVVEVGMGRPAGATPGDDRPPAYLLVEPCEPLVEAVRSALELGIPCHFVDRDLDDYPDVPERFPDPTAAGRIGYDRYCAEVLARLAPSEVPEDRVREVTMAHHVQALAGRVLVVTGIAHVPGLRTALADPQPMPIGRVWREDVRLLHLHADSAREVLSEVPYLQAAWDRRRPDAPDRLAVHLDLVRAAADRYRREEQGGLSPLQVRMLLQYARNLALSEGLLAPLLYDLLLAARGVADDNFAWWFWDEATRWPVQEGPAEIPTIRISLADLRRQTRAFHFHRKERGMLLLRRIARPRLKEVEPGEWARDAGPWHCSYPPEDVVIEGYASFLKQRTTGILAAEASRVEPFTASMRDGIDLRETLRNLAHDGRLYVREDRAVRGRVGSVILVFDPDPDGERFPFAMTWQGEHDDESDMAFYATPPGVHMVGPGISRCEYGGLLMSWPPRRMFQVWEQEALRAFPSRPERLLAAGILYSEERLVAYVAAKPPRALLRSLAARVDRKIVYVPIGQLSPITLRRIRTFHMLHGREVRSWADRYVR